MEDNGNDSIGLDDNIVLFKGKADSDVLDELIEKYQDIETEMTIDDALEIARLEKETFTNIVIYAERTDDDGEGEIFMINDSTVDNKSLLWIAKKLEQIAITYQV